MYVMGVGGPGCQPNGKQGSSFQLTSQVASRWSASRWIPYPGESPGLLPVPSQLFLL